MRTEQEMLDLILRTAKEDERIRAVIMNGSRTNPKAPRDCFQDYDIVYAVREVQPFADNLDWISRFGERIILQMPEKEQYFSQEGSGIFGYLMLFTDGNRIDLHLVPSSRANELIEKSSLSRILLDKDDIINPFPPSSDRDYLIQPPTAAAFDACCNNFWWVSPYVAKGLWRKEPTYAKAMLEEPIRAELQKVVTWHAGIRTAFSVSAGKCGKYLPNYLEASVWQAYLKTFPDAQIEPVWQALFQMGDLFRTLAKEVAQHFDFVYPVSDDQAVSRYLRHIHELAEDATEIYP